MENKAATSKPAPADQTLSDHKVAASGREWNAHGPRLDTISADIIDEMRFSHRGQAQSLLVQSMAHTVWTLGHSTRTLDQFMELLTIYDVEAIADVRRFPGSRKYPHFGQDALARTLREQGFVYEWFESLGGRRRPRADSPNTVWRNTSFRGYADYMQTPPFEEAIQLLVEHATHARTALMCAEAVWWRCHRSMIADRLCVEGIRVVHILDEQHCTVHPMTAPAQITAGRLTYAQPDKRLG